jgi:hypothetical protein
MTPASFSHGDNPMDLLELPEHPDAPPEDTARFYSLDVDGKTALFVLFHTGDPVQLATEP